MSEATVQAALLTLVKASSSGAVFTALNASLNDWTVLDAEGVTLAAVVLQTGDAEEAESFDGHAAYGKKQLHYQIGVTVAAKIGQDKDSTALATLDSAVDTLRAYLRGYPRLNNASGIKEAFVTRTTRPTLVAPATDRTRATHWARTIVLDIFEEVSAAWVEAGQ